MAVRDEQRAKRDALDKHILAHLETLGEGVTTCQLADTLGLSWQVVGKSLRRLAASRQVLVSEVEHQDHRYRVRRVRYYRRSRDTLAALPEWLAPRVHAVRSARLIKGRASQG